MLRRRRWVVEEIGGMWKDRRKRVFRMRRWVVKEEIGGDGGDV